MTAIVMPDIDKSTVDELLKKFPDLKQIELPSMPSMEQVGKTTEETIDRLLGRSKAPVWPWIAAGIGLVAVVGAIAAVLAFWRRPGWESPVEPAATSLGTSDDIAVPVPASPIGSAISTDMDSDLTGASSPTWDSDRPV